MMEALARERQPTTKGKPQPLLEFIPQVTPAFASPHHLKPFIDVLERSAKQEVRAVVSTPPQHAKSQSTLHALVHRLLQSPTKRNAYVTYATQFARDQSYIARNIAERAGLGLEQESLDRWRTAEGGGLLFGGIGGPLTGSAVDGLMVVDDPIKSRAEAESALIRSRIYDWFTSVALTRVHPGASVIIIQTRWHPEDLAGRLIAQGWEEIRLPAISDEGLALWPEARPLEWLLEQKARVGEYDWAAMYQGQPRPKGGQVFTDAHYYDALPEGGYKEAWGADWAYTSKSYADHSVALQGRKYGDTLYITDMIRQQTEVPAFLASLKAKGVNRVTSYMSGTEKAIEQFLAREGVTVKRLPATGDKFTRAQPFAAGWNTGRVLLPRGKPLLEPLLAELLSFTGLGDPHDDIVDAGAGLWAELMLEPEKKPSEPMSFSFSSF